MIPTKYLAKLDPTYQQALVELQNALFKEDASFEFTESCEKLVNEFPLNYLTPNILWEKIWKFYAYNNSVNILQTLLFHFTYPVKDIIRFSYMQNVPKRKLMDKEEAPNHGASSSLNLVVNIEDLRYPHNLLEYYLYCYELNANSHL
uniref:Uncharacterized protein n=1 Tax=Panagrolaimus superbus TaxID=310955 RepID=A0A914Y209_9BILA